MSLPKTITINHPNHAQATIEVDSAEYVRLKTLDLQSSYRGLTEETVADQIQNILDGKPLSVIGMFIKSDIVI